MCLPLRRHHLVTTLRLLPPRHRREGMPGSCLSPPSADGRHVKLYMTESVYQTPHRSWPDAPVQVASDKPRWTELPPRWWRAAGLTGCMTGMYPVLCRLLGNVRFNSHREKSVRCQVLHPYFHSAHSGLHEVSNLCMGKATAKRFSSLEKQSVPRSCSSTTPPPALRSTTNPHRGHPRKIQIRLDEKRKSL